MKTAIGIRAQLALGIVIMTLAGTGFIGLVSVAMMADMAVTARASDAVKTARLLGVSIAASGERGAPGRSPAARAAGAAFRAAGVSDYRVTDPSGGVLASAGAATAVEGKVVYADAGVLVKRVGGGWFGAGDGLVVTAALDGGGSAVFTVPLGDVDEALTGMRRFVVAFAALDAAIVIVFGAYYLSRSIVSPLRRLTAAARRIADGALGERADVKSDDEIGRLAASFNVMAARVEEEIMALERVNNELVAAQDELLRTTTLAAVGRLAAGLAHEVGNPLGAVRGYLDIVGRTGEFGPEDRELVARAAREVDRIDAIVRSFLELSRQPAGPAVTEDVNGLLTETLGALSMHRDFAGVLVSAALSPSLPAAAVDEGRLRQVLMNILLNAAQSMAGAQGEKTVTVATALECSPAPGASRTRRRRDDRAGAFDAARRDMVVVRVTDMGRGIGDEEARRVFEPFFTTREGAGTGLGLFISRSIMEACGGDISFAPSPGGGSTFTVSIPAAAVNAPREETTGT